ncbi:TrkA family potassium uptake protein [Dissulfurirhabdus thermomarina]|uniref:TrkA family potassium uptake protein n=1 Tax=Dissulfurirhabdus thermomarina TaxID=1765737 RepID=A0A6N9TMM0_DISTH|nr:TrkA family potassium uptake protein [Dissulfurirhabdus thermomarina]NDY42379.1 TrkA family potassium uptake protein [Dissulfurirhabdus thermomarina]NMX24319.1 TrkA family potassium uptake protein [Dissulfurirhabdus thermomarina]
MKKPSESFAVLGLSKFGFQVAAELCRAGADVLAADRDPRLVQQVANLAGRAVAADLMDFAALEHLGVFEMDTVVIGLRHSFDVSVLLVNHLRQHTGVRRVVAQVDTREKGEALRLMGADLVVFPERDMADRVARQLLLPNLVDHIALSPETAIVEVPAPEGFVGKSLVELAIRSRFGVYVIGVKRAGDEEVTIAPPPSIRFRAGDTLLVLGRRDDLDRFVAEAAGGG